MIPLTIHTIWHTKELPQKMKETVLKITQSNPEFTHTIYDFNDCQEIIKNNFDEAILHSFNKLKPAAYKSDLARYCLLYLYGGIYLDIKFEPLNNLKFIELIDNEYFCRDMYVPITVYNGLIICKPRNTIMYNCIQQIKNHSDINFYGLGSLDPTGPILVTNNMSTEQLDKLGELRLSEEIYILYKNNKILMRYSEYRDEQSKFQITDHYDSMWRNRDIYN